MMGVKEGIGLAPRRTGLDVLIPMTVCVCILVFAVHKPTLQSQAVTFDDSQYVSSNRLVHEPGWRSAWTFLTEISAPSTVAGYYQPLAMISLMTDYAMGGRWNNQYIFHRTNLILHVVNTVLIIVLLFLLFDEPLPCVAAGLVFGLHPLTVEPTSWIADRKTLLAAFFLITSLVLYVLYVRRRKWPFYLGCLSASVFALMSKPTALPLPVLMLTLDFWPLRRLGYRCIWEKIPFVLVSAAFVAITYVSQSQTAGVILPTSYPIWRTPLIVACNPVFYLQKCLVPLDLTPYTPFPDPFTMANPAVWSRVLCSLLLTGLVVGSLRWTRAIFSGALYFVVALLPTMQVVAFSKVVMSDKFAYIPSFGLLLVSVAFLKMLYTRDVVNRGSFLRALPIVFVLMLAAGETYITRGQILHWKSSYTLYRHMLSLTPNSVGLHFDMGCAYDGRGRDDEAIKHYERALTIDANYIMCRYNLARILETVGRDDETLQHYETILSIEPDDLRTIVTLGNFHRTHGELEKAFHLYERALTIDPDYPLARYNLGTALADEGELEQAFHHLWPAAQRAPRFLKACAGVLLRLAAHPDPEFRNSQAVVVLSRKELLRETLTRKQRSLFLDALAVAYAAEGHYDLAVSNAESALSLARTGKDLDLVDEILSRLKQFNRGQRYVEMTLPWD